MLDYNNIWNEAAKNLIVKEMKSRIRSEIKGYLFKKYGVEGAEEAIKEIYVAMPKQRDLYLEQYKLIIKYNL